MSDSHAMTKGRVKLSNLTALPDPIFANTFGDHMLKSDKKGETHAGLHLISNFKKADGRDLTWNDVNTPNTVIEGRFELIDRAATITIKEADSRAKTFAADVSIYGTAKFSTFFPLGTTLEQAKEYVREAYKDHCVYGTSDHGGSVIDIYKRIREKYGLVWAGLATIGGQRVWVGTQLKNLGTAFPAVNAKFK